MFLCLLLINTYRLFKNTCSMKTKINIKYISPKVGVYYLKIKTNIENELI